MVKTLIALLLVLVRDENLLVIDGKDSLMPLFLLLRAKKLLPVDEKPLIALLPL